MTEAPLSPRASRLPSSTRVDARLVVGIVLVLVSVLVGARLLASDSGAQRVWVASRALAPGTVLVATDLQPGDVRLYGTSGRYLDASSDPPVGYVLTRSIAQGELLPASAVTRPGDQQGDLRGVTMPVAAGHLPPDLDRSDLVDVYVTPSDQTVRRDSASPSPGTSGTSGAAAAGASRLVLRGVAVDRVSRSGGLGSSGEDVPVVLEVRQTDVLTLVQAVADGSIDLVRVPRDAAPLVTASPVP